MDCKAPISEPPTIEAFHLPTSTQSHAAECRVLFVLRKATNVHGWVHMYTVEPTLQPCGLASFFSAKSTVKICKGVFYRRSVPVTAVNGITSPVVRKKEKTEHSASAFPPSASVRGTSRVGT